MTPLSSSCSLNVFERQRGPFDASFVEMRPGFGCISDVISAIDGESHVVEQDLSIDFQVRAHLSTGEFTYSVTSLGLFRPGVVTWLARHYLHFGHFTVYMLRLRFIDYPLLWHMVTNEPLVFIRPVERKYS